MDAGKTITVFNHKGGVGKTTTAVNLAACLAHRHGKRCLVLDMDPQANATHALLGREFDEARPTMQQVLLEKGARPHYLSRILMKTVLPRLILAPADLSLSEAEFRLASRRSRELTLRECLRPVTRSFDYIIIDCAPSLGLLSLNGLAAAYAVLIPCETQFLSLSGLRYVLDVLSLVRARLNPTMRILGALATKFYVLSKANNEALQCMRNMKHIHVFDAVIPRDVKAEEAPSHGKPLIVYAPEARATKQYMILAEEVIDLCQD